MGVLVTEEKKGVIVELRFKIVQIYSTFKKNVILGYIYTN